MEKRGHEILVTVREKDVAINLLDAYNINYTIISKAKKGLLNLGIELITRDLKLLNIARKFDPDILIGLMNPSITHVAWLLNKKSIMFTDTEHQKLINSASFPFASYICTPECYTKDLGEKQVRYNGYHELAYLHPNYFTPNSEILKELGLKEDSIFTILRFVSWNASHDVGQHGIQNKIELVKELEKYGRVLITSEGRLDNTLEKYSIKVSPEKLHHLLYYANLYVGDGATTAVESAILGTPSIYVSSLVGTMGNFIELEETYGLLLNYNNSDEALNKAIELVQSPDIKNDWRKKREQLLKDKIDVTKFIVDFVETHYS